MGARTIHKKIRAESARKIGGSLKREEGHDKNADIYESIRYRYIARGVEHERERTVGGY